MIWSSRSEKRTIQRYYTSGKMYKFVATDVLLFCSLELICTRHKPVISYDLTACKSEDMFIVLDTLVVQDVVGRAYTHVAMVVCISAVK